MLAEHALWQRASRGSRPSVPAVGLWDLPPWQLQALWAQPCCACGSISTQARVQERTLHQPRWPGGRVQHTLFCLSAPILRGPYTPGPTMHTSHPAAYAQEVTVQFNLCMEPWLKYAMHLVADQGLRRLCWTSCRLLREVLFLETHRCACAASAGLHAPVCMRGVHQAAACELVRTSAGDQADCLDCLLLQLLHEVLGLEAHCLPSRPGVQGAL